MKRPSAIVIALIWWLCAFSAPAQQPDPTRPTLLLTNIAQVRALSIEEAQRGYPVRIKGVVTFQTHLRNIFVHDLTNGIYVSRKNATFDLPPGQIVELEGITGPGDYAPVVEATKVEVLGDGTLPVARQVPFDQLGSSQEDCQWVEVRGIVRTVAQVAENRFELELVVAGGRLRVYLLDRPPEGVARIVDSSVRLRGVRGCIFNQKRQVLAPLLFVNASNVVLEELAPEDPFAIPVRPLRTLLQFSPDSRHGHRIKVRGVVTHQEPGQSVFIRDETQGLRLQTQQTDRLASGDIIEALGFETVGKYAPILEDAIHRRVGAGHPPSAARITVAQGLEGTHDADLVAIEGQLVGSVQRGNERVFIFQEDGVVFNALLGQTNGRSPFTPARDGSRLRLTGICLVQDVTEKSSTVRPDTFRVLLRSPVDIVVLQKPTWWNQRNLLWLLGGVTILFFAALSIVITRSKLKLRAQSRERAEAEGRFSAIMAERNRMAREIHDTLAQGYTAISAQLEILKDKVTASPQATKHLELARSFVRSGLAEARRSIWEMRSQALEDSDLPTALANVADQLTTGTTVRSHVCTEGAPRRLPVILENNLLRIGQEAITNAVKHARPKEIVIDLNYGTKAVRLRVRDDGCGFDFTKVVASKDGGFGLVGMKERVQQLSGQLTVKSEPGQGTEIVLEVPAA